MGEKGNMPSAAQHASSGVNPASARHVTEAPTAAAGQHAAPHLQGPAPSSGASVPQPPGVPPVVLPISSDDEPTDGGPRP